MPESVPQAWRRFKRIFPATITVMAALLALMLVSRNRVQGQADEHPAAGAQVQSKALWPISIDYPENGSIFPPDITPPTFLWRDGASDHWTIDIVFPDWSSIHIESKGEKMHVGAIDPECVSETNELPKLTPQQAASSTWTPDASTWHAIQSHSTKAQATVTITGYRSTGAASSQSRIALSTSSDPVGAPIFYRDVPLMPSHGANGTVQPLSPAAIHLIRWRLRDISRTESRTLLTNMPTCANCHSFSADGKTMGIDVDGPSNDKGLYAVVPVEKHISIQNKDVVQWNKNGEAGKTRVGFMSQVSPDGRYVVSTFAGPSQDVSNTYYITNFKDYRFLQVFYPTRGILEWYNRATAERQPLRGADDPNYVQTDGVWSPDGKYVVFARAQAKTPYRDGQRAALRANDPNETPIQYDLFRIPFNEGRGGAPEPILGASQNGMSNNFPKVSPDGRWIVYVQCHNGQLMRPDSKLFIVPFQGGQARQLRANTSLMNSWHSFSPNGRWLVFSSKARSPYTQMYLTHIDADGNDSPAILIDNATAANRAVNLPEFVNIAGDGIEDIQVPAVAVYKLMDEAMQLEEKGENDQALAIWKQAIVIDPANARVQKGLGISLYVHGEANEALQHLRQSVRLNPSLVDSHYVLGKFLLEQGHADEALPELQTAITLKPQFAPGEEGLATAYEAVGESREALAHWRKAHAIDPGRVSAILGIAWILATAPDASLRSRAEAVSDAEAAYHLASTDDPGVLDTLAAAYAEDGQFTHAIAIAKRAVNIAASAGKLTLAETIRARLRLYEARKPFRSAAPTAHQSMATVTNTRQ